jgi:putative two-component system response regulator
MKTIALVDSDQTNLTLLWHLSRKLKGYTSANFLNPVEALEWCKNNEAGLVIIDSTMPEIDTIEFIVKFRQSKKNLLTPLLIMIRAEQTELRNKAIAAGAIDFLLKPIDKIEFATRVNNCLTLGNSQKKLSDQATWVKNEVDIATKKIRDREQEIICRLTKAAEYRDPETGGHIKRMAYYSRHIAMQLGMPIEQQNLILKAAPMHDIGKVGIPDSILLKPGKLDQSEFEIMKEHAQYGHDILSGSPSKLMQLGAEIALSHHEKYDGSGYPYGLKNEEISIYGRIVAVADVFDALTSERPYKKPWPLDDAIGFLRDNSGIHFDRSCVYAFLHDIDHILKIKAQFKDE